MAKASAGGALSGAASGAAVGSMFGPIGTGIGALGGGLMGLFGGGGKKGKMKQYSTLTSEQQQLMKLITDGLASGEGALGELFGDFDKEAFEQGITKPAMKQFQDEILPLLQEKFIAGNQVGGSGMRRGQLKAAIDLQYRLAQLTYQAQQQQNQNKLQGLNTALGTRATENVYRPATQGAFGGFMQGVAPGIGKGLGQAAGKYIAG